MTMALLPSFYDQDVAGASLAYNATSPGAARELPGILYTLSFSTWGCGSARRQSGEKLQ
jgi:hypothetical protein